MSIWKPACTNWGWTLSVSKSPKPRRLGKFSRVKHQDMIILCLHLEQLGRAGRAAARSHRRRARRVGIGQIARRAGQRLRKRQKRRNLPPPPFPATRAIFDEVFLGLIRAGERTGDMSEIYTHLADHFKWSCGMNGWTPERRAKQAAAIRRWRPWESATGPRTPAGKAKVSRNAWKGGIRFEMRSVAQFLRKYQEYLK